MLNRPRVCIYPAQTLATESGSPVVFIVVRQGGDVRQPLTVHYCLGGRTDNVVIPAGAHTGTIMLGSTDARFAGKDGSLVVSLVEDRDYRLGEAALASSR